MQAREEAADSAANGDNTTTINVAEVLRKLRTSKSGFAGYRSTRMSTSLQTTLTLEQFKTLHPDYQHVRWDG